MAHSGIGCRALVLVLATCAMMGWRDSTFVPPARELPSAQRAHMDIAVASAVPALFCLAPTVFADALGNAHGAFAKAAYPAISKINWGSVPPLNDYFRYAYKGDARGLAVGIKQLLELGLTLDSNAVSDAVAAHVKALKNSRGSPNLVCSAADFEAVSEATTRMLATGDLNKLFEMKDAFPGINDLSKTMLNEVITDKGDASVAYNAFRDLSSVFESQVR